MPKILLIDDDKHILATMEIYLQGLGGRIFTASNGTAGVETFKRERPDIVFLDLKLPDMSGLDVLKKLLMIGGKTRVVIITAYATIDTAVQAIKMGAFDYLPKPFLPEQLDHLINRIERLRTLEAEVGALKGIVREGDFITRNPKMRKILSMARQVSQASSGVLISGESGTGKGMVARLIHDWSPRADSPFVTVVCAGLQENLLESDLFGHVKGAFTGAIQNKTGKLEMADNGTVFLDEVSEMSASVQAKFLHFLQHHEFERLGEAKPIRVDVRVIAATNRDLDELVQANEFRQDLYFRLNVVEIYLPPLRARPEDIEILAEYYLERFAGINDKKVEGLTDETVQLLTTYPWPGNIRELVNVIERGVVLTRHSQLSPDDLPEHIAKYRPDDGDDRNMRTIAEVERDHIRHVLLHAASLDEAAKILGIDPATLWRKRKKYNLE